jgi:hypothetical protein
MKASVLGLVVSTAAFGATSIYFWQQHSIAREQADRVAEANRRLTERVTELEKARDELEGRRLAAAGNPFIAGVVNQNTPAATNPVVAATAVEEVSGRNGKALENEEQPAPVFQRPQMPASMIKMMRNQMRVQNEKMYFDLGQRLGLSKEDADKLLDLITEQQSAGFARARTSNDPTAGDAARNDWQHLDRQISDLLGPVKTAEYAEYKKEMPARMEVAMLAQQFEGSDAPLTDQQRTRLIAAISEERDSVPMPTWSGAGSQEQYAKDFNAWQSDYEQRTAERARSILNAEQLTVYDEYQQFQKDLRAQMAAQGRAMPGMHATMMAPGTRMRVAPPPPAPPPPARAPNERANGQ